MIHATSRLLAPMAVAVTMAGCPSSPRAISPMPEAGDGAPLFAPTRTADAVLDDLQASGCRVDGGLASVEQQHARYDRSSAWDCLFGADASVQACGGCP